MALQEEESQPEEANQHAEAGAEVAQSNKETTLTMELEVVPEQRGGELQRWKATWEMDQIAVGLREHPSLLTITDTEVSEVPSLSHHDVVGRMMRRSLNCHCQVGQCIAMMNLGLALQSMISIAMIKLIMAINDQADHCND